MVDANFIFGPYDFYMLVKVEKKMLSDIVTQVRSNKAVTSTMTCYVVVLDDIRPQDSKE